MSSERKFAEEDAEGYTVKIIGKNMVVSEAIKNYLWQKLNKVDRFHDHVMHVTISLEVQKTEYICTVHLKIVHLEVNVHASTTDMYASIDECMKRLQSKLRRWKGRIQDHHKKKLSMLEMEINVYDKPYDEVAELNEEFDSENLIEENMKFNPPKISGNHTLPLKTLTSEEALMKMDLGEKSFLIFKDEVDQKLKVIYRLPDGNYGIVQPS